MPSAAATTELPCLSGVEFRSFQETRPDEERWELIEGVPVMMTPPFIEHNRIASNLEQLLNSALRVHDPSRVAVQRAGLEFDWPVSALPQLGKRREYKPEPDVMVIDFDEAIAGKRFASAAFLLAEIVSGTDEELTPGTRKPWIDVKAELYRAHAPCEAVLIVEQHRTRVTLSTRGGTGWTKHQLTALGDPLVLPSMGLTCTVADLYDGTRWSPRRPQQ